MFSGNVAYWTPTNGNLICSIPSCPLTVPLTTCASFVICYITVSSPSTYNAPLSFNPIPKRCGKKSSPTKNDTTRLTQFCHEHNLPEGLMKVLAKHHITSESVLTRVTEQDFANMKLVVGQEIILHQVIATLLKQTPSTVSMTTLVSRVVSPLTEVSHLLSLPPFKLDDELAKIEAKFYHSKAAEQATIQQWSRVLQMATVTLRSHFWP